MNPLRKEIIYNTPLPISPVAPYLQEIMDKELGTADKKTQEVFVPAIGGKWKLKKK
jgi:hypothetical protein